MALTEVYVDPSIAASSGTGSIGDPYGDVQYALDTQSRDITNGDRFNIKAGTDEILAAALDLSTYGTPTETAPLKFQGYTSAAGDGGIGGISGNGTYAIITSATLGRIYFEDMHLHNCGSATIVTLDDSNYFVNCEIDNTTGNGIILDNSNIVLNCYIHNVGTQGIKVDSYNIIGNCHFENETNDFTRALEIGITSLAINCSFDLDGSSEGIYLRRAGAYAIGNTVYCNGGTGVGITASVTNHIVLNNYVEGFSGVGGVGIGHLSSADEMSIYGHNYTYNNTTNYNILGAVFIDFGNNTALGGTGLTDAANDDFTANTLLKALAYPTANWAGLAVRSYLDVGALQREEAGGTGGVTFGLRRIPI
jgi:hypothetical protein